MSATVRIGTRSSELALFQARQVAALLAEHGVASELVTYTTIGDRILDKPLAAIGETGLFTAELEADLLAGRTDCAVHSLKDLPTADPDGLTVVAMLEREDPRDALVVRDGIGATSTLHPRGAPGPPRPRCSPRSRAGATSRSAPPRSMSRKTGSCCTGSWP
ncbi:MAG: hypothetical protein ACK5XT_03860, partial [Gemmatimonas sp.]